MIDNDGFPNTFHQASDHPATDLHITRQALREILLSEIHALWRSNTYTSSVLFDMTKAEDLIERIIRRIAQ